MVFDISNVDAHKKLFEECHEILGGLNGFVNSAGLSSECLGRGYEPWDITEKEWDALTDINFKAAYFLMRNEIDYMLDKNIRGNILNIASNAACMDIVWRNHLWAHGCGGRRRQCGNTLKMDAHQSIWTSVLPT